MDDLGLESVFRTAITSTTFSTLNILFADMIYTQIAGVADTAYRLVHSLMCIYAAIANASRNRY